MEQEQRVTVRLQRHWDRLRKDATMPAIIRFDPGPIEDVWPYCFRVSIVGKGHVSYRYEYMGDPVIKIYGRDMTNQIVDHRVMEFPGVVIHRKLDDVLATKAPLHDEGHVVSNSGQLIKYRACFLPFGKPEGEITHIIGGLNCRKY